jgi:hypothetical protein
MAGTGRVPSGIGGAGCASQSSSMFFFPYRRFREESHCIDLKVRPELVSQFNYYKIISEFKAEKHSAERTPPL